uniref:Ubiquitin-conjugating enzyme E2 2-like n=1 Tax=Dermatophagoides pteronyssinus TaxID=6956 RepID=A0A6P6XLW5_DERPT|nr:ubiquitin-conjugating enzyme E2 2-like [Dermatophagoides pteronyssinus]
MTTADERKRLIKDFMSLQNDTPPGVNAYPLKQNLAQWHGLIFGPEDTVWEGGIFVLSIKFPENYPDKPPVVKFVTKIFHPNVYADGSDPNPNSPANAEAAKLYIHNKSEYMRSVQKCVYESINSAELPLEQ